MVTNLDEYLSACQLGITITALGLGWLGESTFEQIIHPLFELFGLPESVLRVASVVAAFIIITFCTLWSASLRQNNCDSKAEAVSLWTAKPLILFYKIMFPFIKLLNGSARLLTKLFGFHSVKEHEVAISEEELRLMLSESYKKGKSISLSINTSTKFLNLTTGWPGKSWCRERRWRRLWPINP